MIHPIARVLPILAAFMITCCGEPEENPAKQVGRFTKIQANGDFNIKLVPGPENAVVSTTMKPSSYDANDNEVLVIQASMGHITIAIRDIVSIHSNGSSITGSGPFVLENLELSVHAAGVELNELYVANTFSGVFINTGDYKFSGSAGYIKLNVSNSAYFYGYNFPSDSASVFSQGSVDSQIHVTQKLAGVFFSTGNLYYKGNPPVVETSSFGSGRAIAQD